MGWNSTLFSDQTLTSREPELRGTSCPDDFADIAHHFPGVPCLIVETTKAARLRWWLPRQVCGVVAHDDLKG